MINLQKVEHRSKGGQPGIMMFASPAITPSNNFKNGSNFRDNAGTQGIVMASNSSQIQGRKCDSPQLRVMREQYEGGRSQTASNSMHIAPAQLKKDDFISLYNYHNQIRDLNHTNKEIQKKQFDFNINKQQQRANVTIQYDSNDNNNSNSGQYTLLNKNQNNKFNNGLNNTNIEGNSRHHKHSKSIGTTQKRRQQSQSVPKYSSNQHQPSASIVNTQTQQPLINLHIQNAKIANQMKPQVNQQLKQRRGLTSNNQIPQKYQSSGQQSAPLKSRSKSKNRQKSQIPQNTASNLNNHLPFNYNSQLPPGTQQRAAFMAQATKEILNQSSNLANQTKVKSSFMFSFDNKENESINYNEFSPSRIFGKPQNETKINNFLDSDSSVDSQNQRNNIADQQIAQKLEKQYFLDKSTLLKHLSPEKNSNNSKTRLSKSSALNTKTNLAPQLILSDRDNKSVQGQNFLSNGSTIIHANNISGLNESAINKTANQSLLNIKFKKSGIFGNQANNKILLKGVDKLIKENLKKNKTKEEEEISKRYLEEFKQKLKKNELTQRNQQVRKINASKIMYNHQHKNSQALGKINLQRVGYKKHRSKSCMNKTDSIFGGIGPRSKERLPKHNEQVQQQQQVPNNIVEQKKEKKREKSFVLEIKELQKQIDGEIRREIMQGKIDIHPTSAANKKTNLSTINVKKDQLNHKPRKEFLNMSALDGGYQNIKRSNQELLSDINNHNNRKSLSKDKNKNISQNIKKFMQRKKNAQQQMKSLEQTIENKKHQKIKENLKSLHLFAKQHFRHQSYNFYPKQKQNLNGNFNSNNLLVQNESGKALPIKKLKPQFFNKKKKKSSERQAQQNFDFRSGGQGETIFDNDIAQDGSNTPHNYQNDRYDPNGDVSQEYYEDYQRLLNSIQKHQNQKVREDPSTSYERPASNGGASKNRKSSSGKKRKQVSNKQHSQLQQELESSALLDRHIREANKNTNTITLDNQSRYSSIKNDNVYVKGVVQEKGASLIPPQSDIATLERNHLEKSLNQIHQNKLKQNDPKRYSDIRRSHDSGKTNGRSPKPSEQKAKIKALVNRYGPHNLPKGQLQQPSADTKLLIKLHSAAITIQQNFRKLLQNKGFYDEEEQDGGYASSSEPHSHLYVDSEEEEENGYDKYLITTEKKQIQKQLIAQTSPLRIKAKYQQQQNSQLPPTNSQIHHKQLRPQLIPQHHQQKGNKFYSEDSSDIEKIVVCSVITSGRADNEESLSNTQNYVPLRQKPPQITSGKIPPSSHQLQMQNIGQSSTSSAHSQQNTVIKQNQPPIHQRLQLETANLAQQQQQLNNQDQTQHQSLDISQQSSSSNRKKLVPSLDFGKLNSLQSQKEESNAVPKIIKPILSYNDEEEKQQQLQDPPGSNTARSLFDRNTFQDFQQKIKDNNEQGFNVNNYPKMLQMREDAIKYREIEESKHLKRMVKTKQLSPRTYDIKCKELETWVTKEKEEVKKTRKDIEEQWQKTAQIIEQTQKNQENMKKLLKESHGNQHHTAHNPNQYQQAYNITKTYESLPSENTIGAPIMSQRLSTRREDTTRILDLIDEYPANSLKDEPYTENSKQQNLAKEQQRKYKEQQQQKDQERLLQEQERKREIEQLKEQERQREQERIQRIQEEEKRRRDEQERQEKERRELAEKLRQEKLENERLERDRLEKLEIKRQEKERAEKLKQEQFERERKQRELEEQEKARKLKEQQDLLEQKRIQKEKAEAEERERVRKQKEIQDKKDEEERQLQLQKQEEERQRKQQAQLEKEKQAQLQNQREQEEEERRLTEERNQLKLKQQREAEEQKEKERKEREHQEELERQQKLQQQLEEEQKFKQSLVQHDPYIMQGTPSDIYKQDYENDSEEQEQNLFKQQPHAPHRNQDLKGKDIIESFEDDRDSHNLENLPGHQSSLNKYFDEETPSSSSKSRQDRFSNPGRGNVFDENRGLARTTSSQNLDRKSLEGYQQFQDNEDNIDNTSDHRLQNNRSSSPSNNEPYNFDGDKNKLNDESVDEDKFALQILERQEKHNQALAEMVQKENFFSNQFDDQKPDELLSNLQRTLDETKQIDTTQESKNNQSTIEKIFVQDEADEEQKTQDFKEPIFNSNRLTHQMRSQIPVEQEESQHSSNTPTNGVLPVSPVSASEIRITTGAQSLESTISDQEQIKNAIQEANRSNILANDSSENNAENEQTSEIDKQADTITDDIFRQLMAEMKVDLDLLLLTDPRRLIKEETNSNTFLSESGRFLIFERRGIKTDLFAIERYVEEVLDEILRDQSRFQTSISQPISKNAREVLNQLQNSEIGSYEHFEPNYPVVLPLDLYLRLERRRKESRERELNDTQSTNMTQQQLQDRNFLAECEHIHNKVLFDCINDSLLQFKPYGKDGMPLPWSRQNRRLKPIEEFTIEEMFEIVKHDLFRWAIMQAGTLPRREFVYNNLFDDELFAEIREKKLATLLAREMIENEPKWLNYEFEEAQVKIDIGDMILEQLVTETIQILRKNEGLSLNNIE
eukprot:403346899